MLHVVMMINIDTYEYFFYLDIVFDHITICTVVST